MVVSIFSISGIVFSRKFICKGTNNRIIIVTFVPSFNEILEMIQQIEITLTNMRGFDPASEDDMEDNGMRRFMENNDEGGWG